MKKELFHAMVSPRSYNPIKMFILKMLSYSTSMSRMLCETFSRTHGFGERYWNIGWAIVYTFVLLWVPILRSVTFDLIEGDRFETGPFILHYLSWYVFLAAFMYRAIQHMNDQKRSPSTFDFGKYSYSTGWLDKRFLSFKVNGKYCNIRTIETLIEPGFFVLVGLALILLTQNVGYLIFANGIAYSANRFLDYHEGDQKVLDIIDGYIIQEDYQEVFMTEMKSTRGLDLPLRRPKTTEGKEKVLNEISRLNDQMQRTYVV